MAAASKVCTKSNSVCRPSSPFEWATEGWPECRASCSSFFVSSFFQVQGHQGYLRTVLRCLGRRAALGADGVLLAVQSVSRYLETPSPAEWLRNKMRHGITSAVRRYAGDGIPACNPLTRATCWGRCDAIRGGMRHGRSGQDRGG